MVAETVAENSNASTPNLAAANLRLARTFNRRLYRLIDNIDFLAKDLDSQRRAVQTDVAAADLPGIRLEKLISDVLARGIGKFVDALELYDPEPGEGRSQTTLPHPGKVPGPRDEVIQLFEGSVLPGKRPGRTLSQSIESFAILLENFGAGKEHTRRLTRGVESAIRVTLLEHVAVLRSRVSMASERLRVWSKSPLVDLLPSERRWGKVFPGHGLVTRLVGAWEGIGSRMFPRSGARTVRRVPRTHRPGHPAAARRDRVLPDTGTRAAMPAGAVRVPVRREETLDEVRERLLADYMEEARRFGSVVAECSRAINETRLRYRDDGQEALRANWIACHKKNYANTLFDCGSRMRALSGQLSRLNVSPDSVMSAADIDRNEHDYEAAIERLP